MKVAFNDLPRASVEFVEPMLAKSVEELPTKGDWVYAVKLDGLRAQAMKKARLPH